MKLLSLLVISVLFSTALCAQSTMQVTITNIKEQKGKMMVALHAGKDTFPNDEPAEALSAPVSNAEVIVSFENLPPGEYALSLYQDVNENGELDKNIMGIPKEPFGFSNNAMGTLGAPSFKQCIITVPEKGNVQTSVTLKYM